MRRCEDHDIYLRMTQRYPIVGHPDLAAEYRKHGQNTSENHVEQLKATLRLYDLHETRITIEAATRRASRSGRANKRKYYVPECFHLRKLAGRVAAMLASWQEA